MNTYSPPLTSGWTCSAVLFFCGVYMINMSLYLTFLLAIACTVTSYPTSGSHFCILFYLCGWYPHMFDQHCSLWISTLSGQVAHLNNGHEMPTFIKNSISEGFFFKIFLGSMLLDQQESWGCTIGFLWCSPKLALLRLSLFLKLAPIQKFMSPPCSSMSFSIFTASAALLMKCQHRCQSYFPAILQNVHVHCYNLL